jgi:methyl-accepting chemotaxis protein
MEYPAQSRWERASIRAKLVAAFSVFTILLLCMAAIGGWRLAQLDAAATRMAQVDLGMERLTGEWLSHTRTNAVRATVLTLSDDAQLQRILGPDLEATSKHINSLQQQVEHLATGGHAKELFAQVLERRKAYLAARERVLERRKAGQAAEAAALMDSTMLPAVRSYVESIQALATHYTDEVAHDAAAARASADSGRNVLVTFCVAGVLASLLFLGLIMRSITRPVGEAVATARRIADGDLTMQIRTGAPGEMGELLRALADMTVRLRDLVRQVAEGAHRVADTSEQIAQGNLDLSQRTEEQAGTLEETASSMEELTSTVTQNAESARNADRLAAEASEAARRGGRVVGQVVSTMNGISDSSRRIADITGLIDAIAFQTNILALNAAVEAARAGEQGRGFAVVATEVRQLAQRSAGAAKEIKELIANSAEQVEQGAKMVDAAGRTMDEIVASVKKVSDLIAEIAAASSEQSQGIEQVNTAVAQMEQVVQQNASLAEEASAATESMKLQSAALLQAVARFKLAEGEASAPPPERVVPQPLPRMRRAALASP